MLIGATNIGRDIAPRISGALGTGLTADCTNLDINEKGQLAATRPTFGGQLMATILCKTYPQMATVRPNVFKVNPIDNFVDTEFISRPINIDLNNNKVRIVEFKKTIENVINELDSAEIIVAGGKGLKNAEGFKLINSLIFSSFISSPIMDLYITLKLLKQFADKIGASVGATRVAVEMGLAPQSAQIGQTGRTVTPKIYIACGISGAIQHTVGMEGAQHIIAINNDENAPIFDIADTGIVGDFFEIIPKFLED